MVRIISSILLLVSLLAFQSGDDVEAYKSEAKKLIKEFGSMLKKELVKGFKNGGAVNALDVCKLKAPEIANAITDTSGWELGRTSLKVRNENNTPDDWELSVLNKFEEMKAGGAKVNELEYAEIITDDSVKVFRYMKAIPTGGLCLQCHGNKIKPEVQRQIKKLYPHDKATGFEKGDIRGAFTLSKKIK